MIPSKAIKNEKIMQTLMVQADSGMYRVQDHYFEACRQGLQKQDSKLSGSSDWADSLDATLWPRLSQDDIVNDTNPGAEMVSEDCFVEETSFDNESEWSLDIPEWKKETEKNLSKWNETLTKTTKITLINVFIVE